MSKHFFRMAFAIGLAAIAWVAFGYAGTHGLGFAMTLAIAATYLLGANELRLHRAQAGALATALAELPEQAEPPATLADWLQRVPPALRAGVRQRVEEGRGSLPGPALAPYLVGLLVMLGMLGTFLGLVVTFRGAVFALEGSTDLQAIRAALAEPIRGLGLAFGASVAGVAASAMLGLMSAIARRERLAAMRLLDARAAGVLRPFSPAHRREQALRAAHAQAEALPALVQRLDAMMERMEQRGQQLDAQLLEAQARFQREAAAAYGGLAKDVGASLQDSLAAGARAAGESIRPVVEDAMARIVRDTQELHARVGEAAQAQADALALRFGDAARGVSEGWQAALRQQAHAESERLALWTGQLQALREEEARRGEAAVARLDELQAALARQLGTLGAALEVPLARLLQTAAEVPQAAAGVLAQLRQEMARLSGQENAALRERTVLVERLGALVHTVEQAARQATEVAAHASANAVELGAWGEAFGQSVQLFHAGNEKLVATLQQVESSVARSTARSDEQLAYYVAQAREVIDLSIASQHGVIEKLRELAGRPAGIATAGAQVAAGARTR